MERLEPFQSILSCTRPVWHCSESHTAFRKPRRAAGTAACPLSPLRSEGAQGTSEIPSCVDLSIQAKNCLLTLCSSGYHIFEVPSWCSKAVLFGLVLTGGSQAFCFFFSSPFLLLKPQSTLSPLPSRTKVQSAWASWSWNRCVWRLAPGLPLPGKDTVWEEDRLSASLRDAVPPRAEAPSRPPPRGLWRFPVRWRLLGVFLFSWARHLLIGSASSLRNFTF